MLDEFLAEMESNGGWFPLPKEYIELIVHKELGVWSRFYDDHKKLRGLIAQMFYSPEEVAAIGGQKAFIKQSNSDIGEMLEEFVNLSDEDIAKIKAQEEALWADFDNMTKEAQFDLQKRLCVSVWGSLAGFYNYLALMVHGYSMCELVQMAEAGNDEAFSLAVQIDRTVLVVRPYFQQRLLRAQLGREPIFLNKLAYRLKNPLLNSRIRYRTLWLTFAILDDEGLLDLPREQLLDICEGAGVYGQKFGVEDVGHLNKRLHEYQRNQKKLKNF